MWRYIMCVQYYAIKHGYSAALLDGMLPAAVVAPQPAADAASGGAGAAGASEEAAVPR